MRKQAQKKMEAERKARLEQIEQQKKAMRLQQRQMELQAERIETEIDFVNREITLRDLQIESQKYINERLEIETKIARVELDIKKLRKAKLK